MKICMKMMLVYEIESFISTRNSRGSGWEEKGVRVIRVEKVFLASFRISFSFLSQEMKWKRVLSKGPIEEVWEKSYKFNNPKFKTSIVESNKKLV